MKISENQLRAEIQNMAIDEATASTEKRAPSFLRTFESRQAITRAEQTTQSSTHVFDGDAQEDVGIF